MNDMEAAIAAQAKKTGTKTIQLTPKAPVTKAGKIESNAMVGALASATADALVAATKPVYNPGEIRTTAVLGPVKTWSYSGVTTFERCPHAVKLNKVDGIGSESGPAAKRGNVIHDALEEWVRGNLDPLPHDKKTKLDVFAQDLQELRTAYQTGDVLLEEKWGIRIDWSPCDWDDPEIWGKGALDAFVLDKRDEDNVTCRIIDYKTGEQYGNEMKHGSQGIGYALHAMHRFPDVKHFQLEFWYLDKGTKMIRQFNRKLLLEYHYRYHLRGLKMTETKDFLPNPNIHSCQWCSYGSNKNAKGKPYGNGACGFDIFKGLKDE